jgi:hypothetical protein
MIQDELQRLHGLLFGAIQAMSERRGVLPSSTSTDTAFALGEALMVLAKATTLVTWNIDQE